MNQREFFTALCTRMGWQPTPWRLDVFDFWANNEFTDTDGNGNNQLYDEAFNPLATTRTSPNLRYQTRNLGYGPGNWNSVPVKMYADFESGVQATYETLQLDYYVNIRRCFADQAGYAEAVGPYDFTSWVGSAAYGQRVADFMRSCASSKVMATTGVDAIVAALGGMDAINAWNARGNSLLKGYASEQVDQDALESRVDALERKLAPKLVINGVTIPL